MSFTGILKAKYDTSFSQSSGIEILVRFIKVKRQPKISELTVVSLKNTNLSSTFRPGLISSTCPNIKELDISYTRITDWNVVLQICRELQNLEFLDLSSILFDLNTFPENSEENFPQLKTLVLINLRINFNHLRIIAQTFPEIDSFVLCETREDFTPIFQSCFQNLRTLNLHNACISEFSQILNLENLKNLSELIASSNPIHEIPVFTTAGFESLKLLNLEETEIDDLESINNLNNLSALRELRIGSTPIASRFKDRFRQILIAYLPNSDCINGGAVNSEERTTAERNFVREFSDPEENDKHIDFQAENSLASLLIPIEYECNINIFSRLFEKHGVVHKFAEVNLAPPTEVLLHFQLKNGKRSEDVVVPLDWKVLDLKKFIENLFKIPIRKQKIYHGDWELLHVYGFKFLRYDEKPLYELKKIKDKDIIMIDRYN